MALAAPATLAQVRDEVFTRCTLNTGGDRGSRALKLVTSQIQRAQRELAVMKKLGLRSLLWNVDSQDWQGQMQARPGRIASRTLALLLLHRHGIVLMHDVQPQTPAELGRLLPLLPQLGLRLKDFTGPQ